MTGSSTIGNLNPYVKVSRARDNQGDGERWAAEQVHPTLNAFDSGDTRCVCAVVDFSSFRLTYPIDCCGTLCARDGIKTGRRTPSGQDAWQKKLIVHTRSAPQHICSEKGTL